MPEPLTKGVVSGGKERRTGQRRIEERGDPPEKDDEPIYNDPTDGRWYDDRRTQERRQ